MAHGDLVKKTAGLLQVTLLDGATGVDDGVWVDTDDFQGGSVHLKPGTTGTLQARGSNEATKPANTTHGFQIGADATAETGILITAGEMPRWIKARVSAHTLGTHNAWLVARGMRP